MYEELQIVRESESAEDDLKKRVKELGKTVEVYFLQLFIILFTFSICCLFTFFHTGSRPIGFTKRGRIGQTN